MEFSVNTSALVGLSDLMDRRWTDFESGRSYLKNNAHFSVLNKGILNAIWGKHQDIVDEIDAFLSSAAERFAGPCSVAVTDADVTYLHSDHSAVIRNDAALAVATGDNAVSAPAAATADLALDRSVFADPYCPTARLQPPSDHRGDYPYEMSYFDVLSPTTALRDVIWKTTGLAATFGLLDRPYDIISEAVQPLSGDWARYVACADVYDNLAQLVGDAAACVDHGRITIPRTWTGNAADACARAIADFSAVLRAAVVPLHRTAASYREVAQGVRAEAEALAALLTLLGDTILESGLEALTGGLEQPYQAMSELADLEKVVGRIIEVSQVVSRAHALADAGMGAAESWWADWGIVRAAQPLPAMTASAPSLPRQGSTRLE
jgi:hypothetical protein